MKILSEKSSLDSVFFESSNRVDIKVESLRRGKYFAQSRWRLFVVDVQDWFKTSLKNMKMISWAKCWFSKAIEIKEESQESTRITENGLQ